MRQGHKFAVYHGDNRASFMRCTRSAIEDCFGIRGRVEWGFDEREQRIAHDRDRMRETWPAVAVDWG